MAKLHSDKYQAVSINGAEYCADEHGVFDVPDVVVGTLIADFGMRAWAEPESDLASVGRSPSSAPVGGGAPHAPTDNTAEGQEAHGDADGDGDEDDVDDEGGDDEGDTDTDKKPVNYDKLNTAELLAEAARLGVDPTGMNVKKLRAAVKAVAASSTVSQRGDQ